MASNTETIRRLYDAFARGDMESVLNVLAADVAWTEAEGFPYAGTYVGPDAVLQNVLMKLGGEWEGFSAIPHEFVTEGETVIALGDYSGTFNATGKAFEAPFVHIWKFEGGKVKTFRQLTDTAVVRRALE